MVALGTKHIHGTEQAFFASPERPGEFHRPHILGSASQRELDMDGAGGDRAPPMGVGMVHEG